MNSTALMYYLKKYHYGCSKAVSSGELEAALCVSSREIRAAVNTLRTHGQPICSGETGYFYPANALEVSRCIRQLDGRIRNIQKAKSGMLDALSNHFVDEMEVTYGT